MNRKDVIRIAKESGSWKYFGIDETVPGDIRALQSFAAAIRSATKEEDARICDEIYERLKEEESWVTDPGRPQDGAYECADVIRASK